MSMQILDLDGDVLSLVSTHVAKVRKGRLVVSLPSRVKFLRRLPCVNYGDKLYVVYLPERVTIEAATRAYDMLRIVQRGSPAVYEDIELTHWTNVFADQHRALGAIKATAGVTCPVHMAGHVPLLALALMRPQPIRDAPGGCPGGAVDTEGRLAPPGAEFRINDRAFRRERSARGRLVWVPMDG